MSVEAIMEAPADPDAGARELDVEADLLRALAAATSLEARGRLHDELARHYARRTMYRKMNRHETASAQAYAEGPGGAPLAEALALYARAIRAFGDLDDGRGRELLRAARDLAITRLPLWHSWVQRVTHTLAGRLGGAERPGAPPVIDEIVALRELLEREAIANCGPGHLFTLQASAALAYAYRKQGRLADALDRFERCFRGYIVSPRWVHEAGVLLTAMAATFRAAGDPEGVAPFEALLLAHDPAAAGLVQRSRFERDPALRAQYERRVVAHAAPLFVGRASATIFAQAVATLDQTGPRRITATDEIARAVLALERELGLAPEEEDEDDNVDDAHPLCDVERAFQRRLYEDLWAGRETT